MNDSVTEKSKTRIDDQLDSLGDELDRADSDAIYSIFKALQPLTSPRLAKVKERALREAVQKIWQEPRMPKNRFAHNKPLDYPWSPNARDLYFAHKADPSISLANRLDLEHVTPISILTTQLQEESAGTGCTPEVFLGLIKKAHKPLCFAILTSEDHQSLGKGKKGAAAVAGEGITVWTRYEVGFGLKKEDFMSVTEDPRFADLAAQN